MEEIENSSQKDSNLSKTEINMEISSSNKSEANTQSFKSSKKDNIVDFKTHQKEIEEVEKKLDEILKNQDKDLQNSNEEKESSDILSDSFRFMKKGKKERKQKNINELKLKLMNFKNFQNTNMNVFDNYENIISDNHGCCDDNIFIEKSLELLKKKYSLIEYDEFPIFNRIKSLKRGAYITQINYIEVEINLLGYCSKKYYFLKDNDDYIPLNYNDGKNNINLFVLIEKRIEKNHPEYFANFFFLKYNSLLKKQFEKVDKSNLKLKVKLSQNEASKDYLVLTENINNINCDILNAEENKELNKNLIDLRDEYLKKLGKIYNEKGQLFLEINIEFKTQELDGFLRTTKEIKFEYKYLSLSIPENSFVIVECKNNSKVDSIITNIKAKKNKLNLLGINSKKLYFIGILYDIDEKNAKLLHNKLGFLLENKIIILTSKDLLSEDEKFCEKELSLDVNKILENLMNLFQAMDKRIKNVEGKI